MRSDATVVRIANSQAKPSHTDKLKHLDDDSDYRSRLGSGKALDCLGHSFDNAGCDQPSHGLKVICL